MKMRKLCAAVLILVILAAGGCLGVVSNLLPDESASFEDGSTGGWYITNNCSTANDATEAWPDTKSLRMTATASGDAQCGLDVAGVTLAGSQYKASFKFKGAVSKRYCVHIYGNVSGSTFGSPVVANGYWQAATGKKNFDAGDSQRLLYVLEERASAGDISYIDRVALEASAPAPLR